MLSAPLLGALAGAVWLYLHRVAVTVTPTHVGKVGLIGRPYWRARGDIATVLTATMRKVGDKDTFENLSILDHDGHRIVRMTSVCWSDQDRQRLIQWSGVAPTHLDGVFTGPQLARLYPHAIPAAERHPYLATALMATASAAAAGLVALALLATTS